MKLMNAFGVSGHEEEVRSLIQREIKPFVDSTEVDRMGNLIAKKNGSGREKPRMSPVGEPTVRSFELFLVIIYNPPWLKIDKNIYKK